MVTLPNSLVSRLYEKDSLQNTEDGFELAVKNRLASSTVVAFGPLVVDGRVYAGEDLLVRLERPTVGFGRPPDPLMRTGAEVSQKKSLPFALNAIARVSVAGSRLEPGSYRLSLSLTTSEVGDITVEAVDRVVE